MFETYIQSQIRNTVLHMVKFQLANHLPINYRVNFDDLDLAVIYDPIVHEIRTLLQKKFYGLEKDHEFKINFEVPKNWWQMFKRDNFCATLLRIFPIKYKTITVTKVVSFAAVFPELDVKAIQGRYEIRWLETNNRDGEQSAFIPQSFR